MRFLSGFDRQLSEAVYGRDTPPAVPNAMDDEFNDNSFNTGLWTWLDQGSWTVNESDDRVKFTGPATDGNRIRGVYQTLPSAPCAFEAKIYVPAAEGVTGSLGCLFIAEDASNAVVAEAWWGNPNYGIRGLTWTTPSGAASGLGDSFSVRRLITNPWIYARVEWDGTDYLISYSLTAHGGWIEQHSASPAWTPTLVGLGFGNAGGLVGTCSFGWFRRVL